MKKPEGRLWQRMRPGIAPFAFAQRIENVVGEGVPDVVLHSRTNGRCAFVELKCRPIAPVRSSTPIFKGDYGLNPDQIAWIYERASAGAAIFILGQCADELWLVHGQFSRELATYSREMLNHCCVWRGSARGTDWEKVVFVIFNANA